MAEGIQLHNVEGSSRRTGTSASGCVWTEFEVDHLADQVDGECSICGATIASGWMCLDGGEEVCDEHVEILE